MVRRFARHVSLLVGVAVLVVSAFFAQAVSAATTVRPISDFVSAQGSVFFDFGPVPGGKLSVGAIPIWGNNPSQTFAVDYAGTYENALIAVRRPSVHTWFSGTVIERPLADGRSEDTILLVTHNAIAFMVDTSTFPTNCSSGGQVHYTDCPAIFGYNLPELANGVGRPVLVTSVMVVTLVNTAPGAPLPDLLWMPSTPSPVGAYFQTLRLKAIAIGPARAAFGVPDGTPGLANVDVTLNSATGLDDEQTSLRVLGK